MRTLKITFIIIALVFSTLSFRHVYINLIEPTGSMLDKYNTNIEKAFMKKSYKVNLFYQ